MSLYKRSNSDLDGLIGSDDDEKLDRLNRDLSDLYDLSQTMNQIVQTQGEDITKVESQIQLTEVLTTETITTLETTPLLKKNYLLTTGVALTGTAATITIGVVLGPLAALAPSTLTLLGCIITRVIPGVSL